MKLSFAWIALLLQTSAFAQTCPAVTIEIPSYRFHVYAADGKELPHPLIAAGSIVVRQPGAADLLVPVRVDYDPATQNYVTRADAISACVRNLDRVIVRFNMGGIDDAAGGATELESYSSRMLMIFPRGGVLHELPVAQVALVPNGAMLGTVNPSLFRTGEFDFRELRTEYYINGSIRYLDPASLTADDLALLKLAAKSQRQILVRGIEDRKKLLVLRVTELRLQEVDSVGAEISTQ